MTSGIHYRETTKFGQVSTHKIMEAHTRTDKIRNPPLDNIIKNELDSLESDQSLLVKSSHYWSHMTEKGFLHYERIARQLPFIDEGGHIDSTSFSMFISMLRH